MKTITDDLEVYDILYRYEDGTLIDGRGPKFLIDEWIVTRLTAYIAFLKSKFNIERRMKRNAVRPFAHKNKRDAAYAYAIRKFRHIEHARRSLTKARILFEAVKKANNIKMSEPEDEWFDLYL